MYEDSYCSIHRQDAEALITELLTSSPPPPHLLPTSPIPSPKAISNNASIFFSLPCVVAIFDTDNNTEAQKKGEIKVRFINSSNSKTHVGYIYTDR